MPTAGDQGGRDQEGFGIHLVQAGTLSEYRYLEHGAFWAIIALGTIMLVSAKYHIPETITGRLRASLVELLDERSPGWEEVAVATDRDAVFRLVDARDVDAAASRHVYSGPNDLVGDGRKVSQRK